MIRKKVCILGSFAVGKTSMVQRFVKGIFSDKYLTTLGVKIDKKQVEVDGQSLEFILWDLAGEDDFVKVRQTYLRGAAAYLLVVDGTRAETLDTAITLHQKMEQESASLPFVLLLNKADLKDQWNLPSDRIEELSQAGWQIMETSAKADEGVQEAFSSLATALLEQA